MKCVVAYLSDFDSKIDDILAQLVLKSIDFVIGQRTVHRSVCDSEALGGLVSLWVGELIREFHLFDQISSNSTGQFKKVVLHEIFGNPKCNILVDRRVFGVWLELGDFSGLELLVEAFVVGPEETNVRNLKENHRQTFKTQAKGPTTAILSPSHFQDLGVDNTTSKNLKPLSVVKNFALEGRFCEGEEILGPLLFDWAEQMVHESLQNVLEVIGDHFALGGFQPFLLGKTIGTLDLVLVEELDSLQLVKGGVVRSVNLVTTVDITRAQEALVSIPQMHRLMGTGVCSQQGFVVDVVCVTRGSSRVIWLDSQIVKALLAGNDRILGVEDLVLLVKAVEIVLDLSSDNTDGVVFLGVESSSDKGGNVRRNVVVGVVVYVSIDASIGLWVDSGRRKQGLVCAADGGGSKGMGRCGGSSNKTGGELTEFHFGYIVLKNKVASKEVIVGRIALLLSLNDS